MVSEFVRSHACMESTPGSEDNDIAVEGLDGLNRICETRACDEPDSRDDDMIEDRRRSLYPYRRL
jgi:hypothetical protein